MEFVVPVVGRLFGVLALVVGCLSTSIMQPLPAAAGTTGESAQRPDASATDAAPDIFHGLDPVRIFDSRSGGQTLDTLQEAGGAVAGQVDVQVTDRAGVPNNGVGAVVLNVTVASPSTGGFLTVFPKGSGRPDSSNLNFTRGATIANAVIAQVGTDGQVSIFSSAQTHLVVDISGWIPATSGYVDVHPQRLTDTRVSRPTADGRESGGRAFRGARSIQVTNRVGIPTAGVEAVVLNVTSTASTEAGYLTVFPTGSARPIASNVNFGKGETVANLVIAKIGVDGYVNLFASATTDVVVDVQGWFAEGEGFTGVTPTRIVDTRPGRPTADLGDSGGGAFSGNRSFMVTGRPGVPSSGVGVAVLNVTVVDATARGYSIVSPSGEVPGNASNVNHVPGRAVANTVVAKIGADGKVTVFNSSSAHLLIDVVGWLPLTDSTQQSGLQQLAVGDRHACVVALDSGVNCWGDNGYHQLGNGTVAATGQPVRVVGLSGVRKVVAGIVHTCAVVAGGAVRCWGDNEGGQMGNGTNVDSSTFVRVPGVSGATAISAGGAHTCVVVTGGRVKCWGDNQAGQLGDGQRTTDPGAGMKVPVDVLGLSGVRTLSGGLTSTCAVLEEGSVKCWGANLGGLGPEDESHEGVSDSLVPVDVGVENVESISISSGHTCVLRSDDVVSCWGVNSAGQLGAEPDGTRHSIAPVPGVTTAVAVATAYSSSCSQFADDTVWCWGANGHGQLGDGTNTDSYLPVQVTGLSGVLEMSMRSWSGCARLDGGAVKCWGSNGYGQLGDGTQTNSNVPVDVVGL